MPHSASAFNMRYLRGEKGSPTSLMSNTFHAIMMDPSLQNLYPFNTTESMDLGNNTKVISVHRVTEIVQARLFNVRDFLKFFIIYYYTYYIPSKIIQVVVSCKTIYVR